MMIKKDLKHQTKNYTTQRWGKSTIDHNDNKSRNTNNRQLEADHLENINQSEVKDITGKLEHTSYKMEVQDQ